MRGLILAASLIHFVVASCPVGFELVAGGQCRGLGMANYYTWWSMALDDAVDICKAKHPAATPVIIHNAEQDAYWANKASAHVPPYFLTGINCNKKTKRHEWIDGTAVDFKASETTGSCNVTCSWDIHQDASWNYGCGNIYDTFDMYCIMDLPKPQISFNDCVDFGMGEICYQISSTAGNWSEAQSTCKSMGGVVASIHSQQENNYIRRLAVSQGLVNGALLGASMIGDGSNRFQWIDGSRWDYTNFIPGFPIPGVGYCLVMDTVDVTGEWANVDCATRFPFVCAREPNVTYTCLGANVREGDIISSPGFPTDASMPCDYFLTVPAGMKVEMEIILLEANTCCDHLVLYEGMFGGSVIANLTGEISGKKYRTTAANAMRVSWQPTDGVNVRGMMITYRAVQ